jgi:PAS domain S-box-containing protein
MNHALHGSYDFGLVGLSILIAALAGYAALDLAGRLRTAHGKCGLAWLIGGAIALGSGIWAMHYVGMQAFRLPIPVKYDRPTVVLSLTAAILASAAGLFFINLKKLNLIDTLVGSLAVGGGIAAMHYIGMDAMRLSARCVYSKPLVILSIAVAVVVSFAALKLALSLGDRLLHWGWRKTCAALLLGSAIASMHYIGMAAVSFVPVASVQGSLEHAVSVSTLTVISIAFVVVMLLFVVFLSASLNRRFSIQGSELTQSQLLLQTIFDNMTEGIIVMDLTGRILVANKAALNLLHITASEDFYQSVTSQFQAFDLQSKEIPVSEWPSSRALRGEFVQGFKLLFRHRVTGVGGARELSSAPMPRTPGRAEQRVILTYRDTTDRWLADQARNRLAAIVESSDDAILSKDAKGIITSWNKGAEKIYGYTAEEAIGKPIRLVIPPELVKEDDEILSNVLRGETVDHFETVRKTKSGNEIYVSLTMSPIRDDGGNVIGASKIARDITDRKHLEHQLNQIHKLEALGQLTGGIAHDFNNLLGIILGNLDLLERMVADRPAELKRVQTAQQAANRGAELTSRLLSFASKGELRAAPTNLSSAVINVLALAERTLGSEINLITHLDEALPSVMVDINRLENALLNLIVNARDAMPDGGSISIKTSSSYLGDTHPLVHAGELQSGSYARLSVSDTGSGMSPEIVARVFEPFYTTKARGKGTGLGLAMVYGFIKQSGGAIRIYSEPRVSTTITIYLPFAEPKSPHPGQFAAGDITCGKNQKVLVVDDEESLLEVASSYLLEAGYQPLQASNGEDAMEIIARQPDIKLLITDIVMGDKIDGFKLVERAREIAPHLRFLYCSGFPSEALAERNLKVDVSELLYKPYQRDEFHAAVRQALQED